MAGCSHSALKTIATWIVNVLVPRPGTRNRNGGSAAGWIFGSGETSIAAANCQESSNL